jgi:Ca-activated chloride channel family protein
VTDEELKKLFENTQIDSSAQARKRALDAALDQFDQTTLRNKSSQAQGFDSDRRLTSNIVNLFGRLNMMSTTRRWMYSGMSSAAVIALAVTLVFNMETTHEFDSPITVADIGESEFRRDLADKIRKRPTQPSSNANSTQTTGKETKTSGSSLAYDLALPSPAPSRGSGHLDLKVEEIVVLAERDASMSIEAFNSARTAKQTQQKKKPFKVAELPVFADPAYQGRDKFQPIETNPVRLASEEPVSTFSIDVDTASYSFVRKQLDQGVLPQKDAVRIEEMVNYFPYSYDSPMTREEPFVSNLSVLPSPWKPGNKLVHIGIKGYDMSVDVRSNLVFLLDVSGSMNNQDKLPLVKQSMALLLSQLKPEDTVAIVVYAGAAGTILEPTMVREKQKILAALERLNAGGSTAGAAGIKLAYQLAEAGFVEGGVNRVFLATDGDFNVGITSADELQGFVERKRDTGIYLSVLGFGQGNYQDAMMQRLAQNGNGIAAYIDTLSEARKVLVDEAKSTLFPIANDVKIQVEFNPAVVSEYRLLGYETRMLQQEDFNNDSVDAGEIGAGHSVTAIYEVTLVGSANTLIEPRRYQSPKTPAPTVSGELGFIKIRYKLPGEKTSRLISQPILSATEGRSEEQLKEARFSVAVAGFAQLLRDGKYIGDWSYDDALALALANRGDDLYGYRAEFSQLIRKASVASALR